MIYLITHQLTGGGAEKQLNLFWNYLCENNLSEGFKIFCFSEKGVEKYRNASDIYIFRNQKMPGLIKEFQLQINENKPRIIHFWLPATFSKFWQLAIFGGNYKKVIGLRSNYSNFSLRRLFYGLIFVFNKYFISNTHLDDFGDVYQRIFKQKNFYYIPNGLNLERKNLDHFTKSPFKILFAGRLIPDKNIFTLLTGFSYLLKELPEAELIICGDGPLRSEIESFASMLGIENKVKLEGFVTNLDTYFSDASIFVLPSTREGMPNVAFEAALHNCIVVISDIKQNTRWFTHNVNALVFRTMSAEDLGKKLGEAFRLTTIKKVGFQKENERILSSLTVKKMAENYLKVYNEV